MILTVIFSAIASSCIVSADELDGYTKVDWSWNRDMETTDVNSVIVGGNIPFWRYVNAKQTRQIITQSGKVYMVTSYPMVMLQKYGWVSMDETICSSKC